MSEGPEALADLTWSTTPRRSSESILLTSLPRQRATKSDDPGAPRRHAPFRVPGVTGYPNVSVPMDQDEVMAFVTVDLTASPMLAFSFKFTKPSGSVH
jgi:hypothetical protein